MAQPSSTRPPVPVATFQSASGSDASPADLLEFLRNLITEHFDPSLPDIPASSKETWTTLTLELAGHFLATFPPPRLGPWNTLHEKIKLSEVTLEVIKHASCRVDSMFIGQYDRGRSLLAILLKFISDLNAWINPVDSDNVDIPNSDELRRKALSTTVAVLRCLRGDTSAAAQTDPTVWKIFRHFAENCVATIKDITVLSPPLLPLSINLFDTPCIINGRPDEPFHLGVDQLPLMHITESYSQLSSVLTDLLHLLAHSMVSGRPSQLFMTDLLRETANVIQVVTNFLLSPACLATGPRRATLVVSIIESFQVLSSLPSCPRKFLATVPSLILTFRLREGPKTQWQAIDTKLKVALSEHPSPLESKAIIDQALEVLAREEWGEAGETIRTCVYLSLRATLPGLDVNTTQRLETILSKLPPSDDLKQLVDTIHQLPALRVGHYTAQPLLLGKYKVDDDQWRIQVNTILGDRLFHRRAEMPSEKDNLSDDAWIKNLLDGLKEIYSKPLPDSSSESRIQLSIKLTEFPCALAHPDQQNCFDTISRPGISLITPYLAIVTLLLAGPDHEVNASVQRHVYDAFARALRHHTLEFGEEVLKSVRDCIQVGLCSKHRIVRLASGRALVEFVRLYQTIGRGVIRRLDPLFDMLYSLLQGSDDAIKETTLITVGLIGRLTESEAVGRSLCCLFAQLDRNSTLLKGVTYMQLLALVRHHKKSPYSLIAPYMHQVATFVVSNICQQPNVLVETCRFLSLSPNEFLSVTLPHTLPQLFGSCNLEALEKISKVLGNKVSSMFLKASAEILAHVFMLRTSGQTEKALKFILYVLTEAANNVTIGLGSVVKSCIVPLLATLVIAMGDEDPTQSEAATKAIRKIERTFATSNANSRVSSEQHLGNFLKTYILGVNAHLNDVLQDVQGKKTVGAKQKVLRGLEALITHVGPSVSNVAPQIMATLQTTVSMALLADVALQTWQTFVKTLSLHDLGPHVGPTSATFVNTWPQLSTRGREIAKTTMEYLVLQAAQDMGRHVDEIVDLSSVPELAECNMRMKSIRHNVSAMKRLQIILERTSSDNATVVSQSLEELKSFMNVQQEQFVRDLASGDAFDPSVGQIMKALLAVACRDGEESEGLRLLAFECIGVLGAVDPDRFDIPCEDPRMVVLSNFTDEGESITFALHLIQDVLVGAFRSTSDIRFQSHLAYAIQELLKFCKFTPELVIPGSTSSIPIKVRSRWNALPKHVLETVTPLLEARFTLNSNRSSDNVTHPIYSTQPTYREWIQLWTAHLITRVSGPRSKLIFDVFRSAVRNKDVGVAHHLLPHLVLNVLISGTDEDTNHIRFEITAVLEDQVNVTSSFSSDKRLLSAQAVFMLMDHLNKWIRILRQHISMKRSESKRSRHNSTISDAEEQLLRVDSILASIDQNLIAKAAFECKAYARSLMNFEKQIVLQNLNSHHGDLQVYYDRLHEIYSHLDEPDGMEGISTCIVTPSLEHQIRQHESTGRWTSAQSCWEVRLQQSPDNLEYHLGLLRCLRNLGHYDTLRTHIRGVLIRNPSWEKDLAGFQVEGAWIVNDWGAVQGIIANTHAQSEEIAIGRLLLAMRSFDEPAITNACSIARAQLGAPITAAGERGYSRAYNAVLNLHLVHDLELIYKSFDQLRHGSRRGDIVARLSRVLSSRLDSTLPTFRTQEPILSMHRTAFSLSVSPSSPFKSAIGQSWLASAKIARKAGHWQTAYSAVLQAQESHTPLSFLQSSKLVKAIGEPLRALHELDNALQGIESERQKKAESGVIDLTEDVQHDNEYFKRVEGKAKLLRARWMRESERYDTSVVIKELADLAKTMTDSESAHFHAGHFQDETYKILGVSDRRNRGARMNLFTVRAYSVAVRLGSKYAYQTIPRLLTLWLDMGENPSLAQGDTTFASINSEIESAIKHTPVYKWLTAFPQIVSRVDHKNATVYTILSRLIVTVLQEYPQQGLWLFMSVVKSTKPRREKRGKVILDQLKNNPQIAHTIVPQLVTQCLTMTTELLNLCDFPIKDDHCKTLSMSRDFPVLSKLAPSQLIIPLQESLTANLPSTSSKGNDHQPFPHNAPTIAYFFDEIDIMRTLAKPRKITIRGDDGQIYMFLGKPKDDLRKDARLMDFNSIINKLLRTNSESRRRQLRIRTYSVVTLNEECGFIQWVPNTTPIRPVIVKYYSAKGIESWTREMGVTFSRIKEASDKEASLIFQEKIIPLFPPIFHEWFIETFPEPSAWLSSRLAYARTAAVMSMVGFILGLGDRHLENILMDTNTGDVVHVDFNCLFEKGKTLETPERVPFRLTHNMVDALGVTGAEGVFRIASEITMQLLRNNKEALMSVLDAFIHDPLVEWEDEKRKIERQTRSDRNAVKDSADLRKLAKNALNPIEKKLKGIYVKESNRHEKRDKEISTSNLVQMLIEEATDQRNLSKMYPGWAPWH